MAPATASARTKSNAPRQAADFFRDGKTPRPARPDYHARVRQATNIRARPATQIRSRPENQIRSRPVTTTRPNAPRPKANRSQHQRGGTFAAATAVRALGAAGARRVGAGGQAAFGTTTPRLRVLAGGRTADLQLPRLERALRGRIYIAAVGLLLVGLVLINVNLLSLNRDINRYVERTAQVKRANSGLVAKVARLESSERIARHARGLGLVMPTPEQFRYLTPRAVDARRAASAFTAPKPKVVLTQVAAPAPAVAPITSAPTSTAPPAGTTPVASPPSLQPGTQGALDTGTAQTPVPTEQPSTTTLGTQ